MTESDGEVHLGNSGERGIDLTELDPEAAHLDLEVGAADELQLQIVGPSHHVAGAIHPCTLDAVRIGHEALGGQPWPTEITAGKRTARQIQVTRDTGRNRLESGVENEHGHAVNRSTDGDRRTGRQLGEAGDDRGLGRPVPVEVLSAPCPPGEQFGSGHVSAHREHLERIDPVGIHRAEHRGRDDRVSDPLRLQQFGQFGAAENRCRYDDQRRPDRERRHPFQDRRIEVGRADVQEPRGRFQVIEIGCCVEDAAEPGVRDDDTLRLAGRTRGVDDVGRVLERDRSQAIGVGDRFGGVGADLGDELVLVDAQPEQSLARGGELRRVRAGGQAEQCLGVRDHVGDAILRIRRVDG